MDVRLLILFVLHPIICFPLDYDAEADKFFAVEGIKNPTSREKGLARKIIYERQQVISERQKADDLIKKLGKLESEKDNLAGVIGAVVGRGAVESFRKYIKKYLPTKAPNATKVPYTSAEIQKAYVDCFTDSRNPIGKSLLEKVASVLPDMDSEKLAHSIRKMYGKCSYIIHSLFENLVRMESLANVLKLIQVFPASLNSEEKLVVEKIAAVILDFDESYTDPPQF